MRPGGEGHPQLRDITGLDLLEHLVVRGRGELDYGELDYGERDYGEGDYGEVEVEYGEVEVHRGESTTKGESDDYYDNPPS